MKQPKTHAELDALIETRLTPLLEELAAEFGILTIAVCGIEHSDLQTVVANMGDSDAKVSLTAALYAYEHQVPIDHTH